jgi:hypothetical protein
VRGVDALGLADGIRALVEDAVREVVLPAVRDEIRAGFAAKATVDDEVPHPSAWWAVKLGCTAESLVKRARRGTLAHARRGTRYYFTRAQIEGRDRR